MKRMFAVLLAAVAVFALAACGGGNNATNGNAPKANEGHDHEHGEAHKIGEKTIGDYKVEVSRIEDKSTTEGVYEVKVTKDGKAVKGLSVGAYIGDTAGIEKAEIASGEWSDKEEMYDCHVKLPADVKDMRLWVRVGTGAGAPRGDFNIDHD